MPDEGTPEPDAVVEPEAVIPEPDARVEPEARVTRSEIAAAPPVVDPGYTPSGVPTFESVREKIETRYGTALGAAELGAETPEGRAAEEQYEARQQAAAERVKQIRESMRDDS